MGICILEFRNPDEIRGSLRITPISQDCGHHTNSRSECTVRRVEFVVHPRRLPQAIVNVAQRPICSLLDVFSCPRTPPRPRATPPCLPELATQPMSGALARQARPPGQGTTVSMPQTPKSRAPLVDIWGSAFVAIWTTAPSPPWRLAPQVVRTLPSPPRQSWLLLGFWTFY